MCHLTELGVDTMSDFLLVVKTAFEDLLDKRLLRVESSILCSEAFGNAAVVLSGRHLRIRVVRDRDQMFADAASCGSPEAWYPLQMVLRAVGVASAMPEGLLTPSEAAKLVEDHFTELDDGLAGHNMAITEAKLAELRRVALREFLDRSRGE